MSMTAFLPRWEENEMSGTCEESRRLKNNGVSWQDEVSWAVLWTPNLHPPSQQPEPLPQGQFLPDHWPVAFPDGETGSAAEIS